ncbi:MAG: hypothetical protein V2I76_13320 [Roseobacter sp.]|jgi:hypothetical protein|nr:hypothetical protein [Roseobacter sp.]
MMRFVAYLFAMAATPAMALTLGECTRVTHVSHGGEADHVDLGEGRVMWREWWSQEGSSTDILISDCAPGEVLRFRTAEENMSARAPFDRTEDAMRVVARHETGSRVFATLARMSADLEKIARDVVVRVSPQETCACAAVYPQLRGQKQAFQLEGL